MEREYLEKIIEYKLEKFNMLSFQSYKPNIQEHLLKIEECIQMYEKKRQTIFDEHKKLKINVMSISKNTKIARQTIYNNRDCLEFYIQCNQVEFEKNDILSINNEDKNFIDELKESIKKLNERDLTEQLRLDELEELRRERDSLINEIKLINKNNILLQKEIERLKVKFKGINNIIEIDKRR